MGMPWLPPSEIDRNTLAFLLKRILEDQGGFMHLDLAPRTLTAKAHRPAYGSDGDYFSKPSLEDIVEEAYSYMSETDPLRYPTL
jgi:hypothetical protein